MKVGLILKYRNKLLFKIQDDKWIIPLHELMSDKNLVNDIKRIAKESFGVIVDDTVSGFYSHDFNIQYFIWDSDKRIKLDNFEWISFENILENINKIEGDVKNGINLYINKELVPKRLFKLSDKELISKKGFIAGTFDDFGNPDTQESFSIIRLNESLRRNMEMMRRFKNSMDKSNCVMIALTIILVVITIVQIITSFNTK